MEAITKYKAIDGSEWRTEKEAMSREALFAEIESVMAPLAGSLAIAGFDSDQFYQHEAKTVIACRVAILALAAREFPTFDVFRHKPPEEVRPLSIAGRILDDCGGPLNRAWARFARIDDLGREWQQPYFANNTPANPVQVNHTLETASAVAS